MSYLQDSLINGHVRVLHVEPHLRPLQDTANAQEASQFDQPEEFGELPHRLGDVADDAGDPERDDADKVDKEPALGVD